MYDPSTKAKVTFRKQGIFMMDNEEVSEMHLDERHRPSSEMGYKSTFREVNCIDFDTRVEKTPNFKQTLPTMNVEVNTEVEEPSQDWKDLTASFFKKSSIYALSQIGHSNTLRRKIFWAFILIGGLTGCFIQVNMFLGEYFTYPVVINIDSANVFHQEFPGVTICNLNYVRNTYFSCVLQRLEFEDCNTSASLADASSVNWTQPQCDQSSARSTRSLEWNQFVAAYFSISQSSRVRYGHQLEDLIQSCSFNSEQCNGSNFVRHPDYGFGNCFIFKNYNGSRDPLRTSFIGPNSGLTLELDVESAKYASLTESVGIRVIVHDPHQDPSQQDEGVMVSPGFDTAIALSKIVTRRLPHPYKDRCKSYGAGDSKKRCDVACFQRRISLLCSCFLPSGSPLESGRYCDFANVTEFCCVNNWKKVLREDYENCNCPLECESCSYGVRLSSGVWPSGSGHWDASLEQVRETKLKLRVYYETLEQLTFQQKPMFGKTEVLSQVGGQMGLWLGLSLAALFECLENIVLVWQYQRKKLLTEGKNVLN